MNYSEEERKAIEKIRSFNQYNWEMNNLKGKEFAKPYFDALDTILNLIQKQDKKIELLSKKLYLCTPEIPQNEHQEYVSYVDLINKIIKQDKIIDKMAEQMVEDKDWFYSEFDNYTKQDFIEYFKKEVEKDVKDKRAE